MKYKSFYIPKAWTSHRRLPHTRRSREGDLRPTITCNDINES